MIESQSEAPAKKRGRPAVKTAADAKASDAKASEAKSGGDPEAGNDVRSSYSTLLTNVTYRYIQKDKPAKKRGRPAAKKDTARSSEKVTEEDEADYGVEVLLCPSMAYATQLTFACRKSRSQSLPRRRPLRRPKQRRRLQVVRRRARMLQPRRVARSQPPLLLRYKSFTNTITSDSNTLLER
jgi:hypothetical protein